MGNKNISKILKRDKEFNIKSLKVLSLGRIKKNSNLINISNKKSISIKNKFKLKTKN